MSDQVKSKAEVYREHVLVAQNFKGSDREYCRRNGLEAGSFYNYKSEMRLTKKPQKKFVQVTPKIENSSTLPDAKWTVEFLRHFLAV